MSKFPVIVSITSLPSRISRIRPCLESLLSGTLVPDKILLPLPKWSDRERAPYVLPDFLKDNDFAGRIVEVVDAARDWGPGTKLLGALTSIPDSCHLVVADDDVRYKPNFLDGIVSAQRRDNDTSFSYYTYNLDGLTIGQGCDGFSFYSPNLDRILPFAEKHVMGTKLFFHDDFWISFFLATKGISVEAVGGSDNGSLIYNDEFIDGGSLRFLDGSFLRDPIQREGMDRLLRDADMPASRRARLLAKMMFNRVLAHPYGRVTHKLRGVLRRSPKSIDR